MAIAISKQHVLAALPTTDGPPSTVSRETKRRRVEVSIQTKITSETVMTRQPNRTLKTKATIDATTAGTVRMSSAVRSKTLSRIKQQPEKHECLLTPNRKKVDLDDFLLSVDAYEVQNHNQARTHAAYRAELDQRMMEMERWTHIGPWFASFGCIQGGKGRSFEECRLEAVRRFFLYGKHIGLRGKTVHLAVHTLGRLLTCLVNSNSTNINERVVVGCIGSAWRMATKWNEVPHIAYQASIAENIEKHLTFLPIGNLSPAEFDKMISRVETKCAEVLGNDIGIPFAVDFFDRFLEIGGWPSYLASAYRELGHFLLSISQFSTRSKTDQDRNTLFGTLPSQLAAAALALSVKIINTDANMTSYDFYPPRLEIYTGYDFNALRPTIRGISTLLRVKPKEADVLEGWFPTWAKHGWQ